MSCPAQIVSARRLLNMGRWALFCPPGQWAAKRIWDPGRPWWNWQKGTFLVEVRPSCFWLGSFMVVSGQGHAHKLLEPQVADFMDSPMNLDFWRTMGHMVPDTYAGIWMTWFRSLHSEAPELELSVTLLYKWRTSQSRETYWCIKRNVPTTPSHCPDSLIYHLPYIPFQINYSFLAEKLLQDHRKWTVKASIIKSLRMCS